MSASFHIPPPASLPSLIKKVDIRAWRLYIYIYYMRETCRHTMILTVAEQIIIIHSFYIVLFSALEQTRCAHWHVILNE